MIGLEQVLFYLDMNIFARLSLVLSLFLTSAIHPADAQETLPPCSDRPTALSEPWIRAGMACLERVIDDPSAGEFAFTALAATPDGTLYAARPSHGQVIALIDEDGDGLPESPRVAAEGLTLPNALAYDDDALYITGGPNLYALRDGELTRLVDDLPTGEFWTGGVAVLEDRIYVGIGAACDACDSANPEQGAVLSFALDGSDRRVVATGLHNPSALTVHGSDLYVTDAAPDALFGTPDLDEVNHLSLDAPADFSVETSVAALPTGSTPTALASYMSDAIPSLANRLLVVLNGSRNSLELRGYRLVAVDLLTGSVTDIMPAKPDDNPGSNFTADQMNYRGSGFYPHRPMGVAVTEQGSVYLSIGGGRILALRP